MRPAPRVHGRSPLTAVRRSHTRPRAESAKEKPLVGVIVAAGPGKKDEEMKLAVGDKVVYFKYAGDKMTVRAPFARRNGMPAVRIMDAASGCERCSTADAPCPARQDDKGTEFVVLHQNDILGKL